MTASRLVIFWAVKEADVDEDDFCEVLDATARMSLTWEFIFLIRGKR